MAWRSRRGCPILTSMSAEPKYVDHPAPSVVLMLMLLGLFVAVTLAVPAMAREGTPTMVWVLILGTLAASLFYCWPFYSTYYTLSPEGIQIRYGPWTRRFPWTDFTVAYWRKGMFATRIGLPGMTPCVRLTDAVMLKWRHKWFGLYLTPNDSRAFLGKIAEFAPELTRETVF